MTYGKQIDIEDPEATAIDPLKPSSQPTKEGFQDHRAYRSAMKRFIDLIFAPIIFICALPAIIFAGIAIKLTSKGPLLCRRELVGAKGHALVIYKLRTMVEDAEQKEKELVQGSAGPFFKPAYDNRITPVGRYIRKLSIDELPQLLNVVRGDMSLVGPRPVMREEFELLEAKVKRMRIQLKPGITGLWQVMGRSHLSDVDRVRYDMEYIEKWSIKFDLWIILKSVPAVIFGTGAR